MPERRIAKMTGLYPENVRAPLIDHHPQKQALTPEEMREFLKEEQKEGMHPSLKGKHF